MNNDAKTACRQVGAMAIEVADMLARFPRLNTPSNQQACPDKVLAAWLALSDARRALLDWEQSAPRHFDANACEILLPGEVAA